MENSQSTTVNSKDKQHVWHHITQHAKFDNSDPVVMVEGQGLTITDSKGREFLDASSGGVWTVNVGYGRKSMGQAIYDAVIKVPFFAGNTGTVPGANYAAELIDLIPHMSRVYYSNSGSEANEKAYKMVRQRAHAYNGGKKHKIVFRDRDYHGTTIGALSSTGHPQRRENYGPFAPGFVEMPHCCCYRCPFGKKYPDCNIECATALEDIVKREDPDTVGAVVLEPITAGGGVIPPVKEYFPIISEICKKYDLLLHIDEVVCGMGRTGLWFGHSHYDVKPDIISMAKGVASGYAAISVTLTTEDVFKIFKTNEGDTTGFFRDISTFGGCTGGPAAALENLRIIKEENLLENAVKMGEYLLDKLNVLKEKHAIVGDARGKGLFAGLELVSDKATKLPLPEAKVQQVIKNCFEQGVIIGSTNRSLEGFNNTLTLSPALICTKSDIDTIIATMDVALSKIEV
jgi:taurine-pyruvate aminotransferase